MSEQVSRSPEFGTGRKDITAFNEAISAVNAHNEEFGLGKLMARALFQHLDESERAQEFMDAGLPEEEAIATSAWLGTDQLPLSEEQQMARTIVGITHAPILEATGLTLSPLRSGSTMYSNKGQDSVGRVRLQITDGGKFSAFLGAVKPRKVNEDFRKNVTTVTNSLIAEASDAITQDADEDTVLETLAYANGIISGLKRIGLGDSLVAKVLEVLTHHSQQGDIKEYLLAERSGLLEEAGNAEGFGPSRWQRDSSNEYLAKGWNGIIDVLKAAKANPKAEQLFKQLLQSARAHLKSASDDWDGLKTTYYADNGYGSDFENIFQAVKLEMDMLVSPDEDLR